MPELDWTQVTGYRTTTYRTDPSMKLTELAQAQEFVGERGFVFFWPIQGVDLPSLWVAVAGDRPVADAHDDPGHVTWGWKDAMLGQRVWYYAKLLRKRATMISLEIAPFFYALTENFGAPGEDYLIQYEEGRMKQETKRVYEILLQEGPLDTVNLRQRAGLTSRQADYRFNRSLVELQVDMKILPVGVAETGAWRYSFIYELVPRHLPELPEKARHIGETEAREKLLELYLASVGAVPLNAIRKVFSWEGRSVEEALGRLSERGVIQRSWRVSQQQGEWVVLSALLTQSRSGPKG